MPVLLHAHAVFCCHIVYMCAGARAVCEVSHCACAYLLPAALAAPSVQTAAVSYALLALHARGFRRFEAIVGVLVVAIAVAFGAQLVLAEPSGAFAASREVG